MTSNPKKSLRFGMGSGSRHGDVVCAGGASRDSSTGSRSGPESATGRGPSEGFAESVQAPTTASGQDLLECGYGERRDAPESEGRPCKPGLGNESQQYVGHYSGVEYHRRPEIATRHPQGTVQAAFVKILTPEQETEYQQLVSQPRNRSRGRPAGGHFATDSHQARTPVAREDKTGNCPPGVQDFVAHPECCGQAEAARRQSMYGGRIPCFGEEVNAEAALHDGDRTRKDRDRCAQLFEEHRSDHFGNGTAVQEGTSSDEEGGGRSRKWIGSHCGLEDDERHWRHATDPSRERRSRT
jgi:hypothetical protein